MRASKLCLELIKEMEGFFPEPYICPAGKRTIGYGHIIKENETLKKLSEQEAEKLLIKDIEETEQQLEKVLKVKLSQYQWDALVSFTFNLGIGNLKKSTLLKLINSGRMKEASNEFKRWIYAGGKILNGLIVRRRFEKILWIAGIDKNEELV